MRCYFEGWYLKHQYGNKIIAFIPARHADEDGKWSASIQVITDEGAWYFPFSYCSYHAEKKGFDVTIGENRFSSKGIKVNLRNKEISIVGEVQYGVFEKIGGDIMGPFRFFPFMQCRHSVLSMYHKTKGTLTINNKKVAIDGTGYIEGDRGNSFPRHYIWTQCILNDKRKDSIMFSAADIPMWGFHFCGCICAIYYKGREYRLATYKGCRIVRYSQGKVMVKQGKYLLKITKISQTKRETGFSLHAPKAGKMSRMIKESPSCAVRYQFWEQNQKVFNVINSNASFEQSWEKEKGQRAD